ncbi:amino acid ABC transporter permease [Halotalea alkalilenta]|uniref:amino acid ABC transporter permease n=1 Tax=Halotalea alkalilenta TaxID=376489 RepID=UPI0004808CD3|nr:amino acid ABC transporter permease [Halotalea alkalilenta]
MVINPSYEQRKRLLLVGILLTVIALVLVDAARGGSAEWSRVIARLPLLLTGSAQGWPITGGFLLNVVMGIASMAIATAVGTLLGLSLLARRRLVRQPAFVVMNFLRNAPWLVVLFAMLYLLPYRLTLLGVTFEFSPLAKAIIGLSLPTAANFAEVIRGAVQSVHAGQWESARSLGYSTAQIYRRVILPQAFRRMIPGWMNLYALLMIATSLATVTGVQEVVTLLRTTLSMESETTLVYFYLAVLAMFFAYCYPIALLARRLENKTKGDSL